MQTGAHEFITAYLRYTHRTESPPLFHIWAALSGLAAAMGRRCYLPKADGPQFPNMYIALCGPPAVRKSTAIRYMKNILRETTEIRFAPNDTGGQRQGLIAAMRGGSEDTQEKNGKAHDVIKQALSDISLKGLDAEASLAKAADGIELDTRDPYSMYVVASELNSILGENNTAMLTFLQTMWDGDEYTYHLRSSSYTLNNALLNIVSATTPTQIALALPPEAVGQGFMSRFIFVYEDHIRKVFRAELDSTVYPLIAETYSYVFNRMDGEFTISRAADELLEQLYMVGIVMQDPRFSHYCDRRMSSHIYKVAMCLAASRKSLTIELADAELAHQLLTKTEERMPDALGEYGMNKLSAAKQRLLEFIRGSDAPIPYDSLYGMLSRDMAPIQFRDTMHELKAAQKITTRALDGVLYVIGTSERGALKARADMTRLRNLLEPE